MLTKEEILSKTPYLSTLSEVKNLNLWGKELNDISVISQMIHLEILSLSVNNISSLSPLSSCIHLKELYLRKNNISSLSEIDHLTNCKALTILWLEENPICQESNYREYIISKLPLLVRLDNVTLKGRNQFTSNGHSQNPKKKRVMAMSPIYLSEKPVEKRDLTCYYKQEESIKPFKAYDRYDSYGKIIDNKPRLSIGNELRLSKKIKLKIKISDSDIVKKEKKRFPILINTNKNLVKNDTKSLSTTHLLRKKSNNNEGNQVKIMTTILGLVDDMEINEMILLNKEIEKKMKIKMKIKQQKSL